jgi:hypothetical protein
MLKRHKHNQLTKGAIRVLFQSKIEEFHRMYDIDGSACLKPTTSRPNNVMGWSRCFDFGPCRPWKLH